MPSKSVVKTTPGTDPPTGIYNNITKGWGEVSRKSHPSIIPQVFPRGWVDGGLQCAGSAWGQAAAAGGKGGRRQPSVLGRGRGAAGGDGGRRQPAVGRRWGGARQRAAAAGGDRQSRSLADGDGGGRTAAVVNTATMTTMATTTTTTTMTSLRKATATVAVGDDNNTEMNG